MSLKQLHKRLRQEFNEICLERDGHMCKFCHETKNLDVHHIIDRHDMPNGGYASANGITVCEYHHLLCEFRTEGYTEDILYRMINTTFDIAYEACEKLI